MSNELTYAQAAKRLKELQYAKGQMGQLSINDEIHKKALEIAMPILEQQERGEWIEWGGGECPVDGGVMVETRWSDGSVSRGEASDWRWEHHSLLSNLKLIAYRIIPERATNQNGEDA